MDAAFRFQHAEFPDGNDGEQEVAVGGGVFDCFQDGGREAGGFAGLEPDPVVGVKEERCCGPRATCRHPRFLRSVR